MHIIRITDFATLEPWAAQWNQWSGGIPFRRWEWLECWWRHYGFERNQPAADKELYVLAAFDDDGALLAAVPWYLQRSWTLGSVIRFLGSGEVCSDYVGLLCRPDAEHVVLPALAEWVSDRGRATAPGDTQVWDALEISGIAADDKLMAAFLAELDQRGTTFHPQPPLNSWRLELPDTWDAYLAMLSKPHRRRVRQLERTLLDSGRIVVHAASTADQLRLGLQVLIDLHQRRRAQLGQPGCFASQRFTEFHREVMSRLLKAGLLRLTWFELDGQPVAAEYQFEQEGTVYAYQSGIDPDRLDCKPGWLANTHTIRQAIARGDRCVDFLRGDEPYKAQWRATPRPLLSGRVVPDRTAARLRHGVLAAGNSVKTWLKSRWKQSADLVK